MPLKQIFSRLKPYLRWVILGGTLFFLATVLHRHWQDVAAIRIDRQDWLWLAIALLITLIAHIWTGWVWGWILQFLKQPVSAPWSIRVYLKTNIAKYLPGNVWHFYGRVWSSKAAGVPIGVATLSVLLEPLLMAAAALMITLLSSTPDQLGFRLLGLVGVLAIVHPRVLNPVLKVVSRSKVKDAEAESDLQIHQYPWLPLLGELGFVGLRGIGFLFTFWAISAIDWHQVLLLIGAFSFAWLLGLVIPGAPGGIGVFEATAIALLQSQIPSGVILSVVALYRLISVLAEAIGAGLAWLVEQMGRSSDPVL